MQQVFKLIGQVAAVGRHRADHRRKRHGQGTRRPRHLSSQPHATEQPFLAVNCAAIPENLLESELFGHEKGAFTGAAEQRIGKFEQCDGGTIFLDEIGDMPLATQTKILRVLQKRRVPARRRQPDDPGGRARHRRHQQGCRAAVAEKKFREDLFYRLNVVRISSAAVARPARGHSAAAWIIFS